MQLGSRSSRGPLIVVLIILIALGAGFGYYYSVTSSALSSNSQTISSLQNLANARASIKVVAWLSSSTDTTSTYQVRITNNNGYQVTLAQLTINVVDNSGNLVGSNTVAPQIVVTGSSSVSTSIIVSPSGGAGASVSAIISTPYGQIIVGS
jgi:Ca2+/Na+ antiporter